MYMGVRGAGIWVSVQSFIRQLLLAMRILK